MKNSGKKTLCILMTAALLLSVLSGTGLTALAEGEPDAGGTLALRFICDGTDASVTVYDAAGPVAVGPDGIHHLVPGTYCYSASAEGYESRVMQPFTIPADAVGDQELRFSLTPLADTEQVGTPASGTAAEEDPEDVEEDPDRLLTQPEDDGRLRIRPVDGSLTLTVGRETRTETAVPEKLRSLAAKQQKPLQTADGKPVEKKLWLQTPGAEELYLDRLALEKELGYYTADWTVLNLTDEEGERKNLAAVDGWYDVTFSGPATEKYRDFEPVFALLTLHWDEEGDIIDRDVTILETTHTPTKSSWSFSTDALSTLVVAVPTSVPVEEEKEKEEKTVVYTFTVGEEIYAARTVKDGDELKKPEEDPSLDGFVFEGWYIGERKLFADADGDGVPEAEAVTVMEASENVTVKARFTEIPPARQRLVFRCMPESANVIVFPASEWQNLEPSILSAQEDGSFLLLPGEYFYCVTAEGYASVIDHALSVVLFADGAEQTVEVTLEPIPVEKLLIITPDILTKVYGEEDPVLTFTVEGLEEGDILEGALAREAGENVGAYAIMEGTLDAGEKYTIVLTDAYLTITKADAAVVRAPEPVNTGM